jgi:hypothetical protein
MHHERSRLPGFPPGTLCSRERVTPLAIGVPSVPGKFVPSICRAGWKPLFTGDSRFPEISSL